MPSPHQKGGEEMKNAFMYCVTWQIGNLPCQRASRYYKTKKAALSEFQKRQGSKDLMIYEVPKKEVRV